MVVSILCASLPALANPRCHLQLSHKCLLYDNRFQRECLSWHPVIRTSTMSHQNQVWRYFSRSGRTLPDLKLASHPEMATSHCIDRMIHVKLQGSEAKQKPTETVEQPLTFAAPWATQKIVQFKGLKGRHHTKDHIQRTIVFSSVTESNGETPALRK